ncbi:MAG: GTPase HflX [Deltaproteobacteria bacterium]|nr:GTPase HflX [Deltaproteobacteria bacterium]MBW1953498.1 GTPase HflX [Deltaproteobacteria bacterium]MBW1987216.1 GTPase HflX [Deltaproteobacteria bacterium]MBW2134304.1 GTPase HflX [Deltaproteobacteria bacterium]
MDRTLGNLTGLKPQHLRRLDKLYRRKVTGHRIITPELARQLAEISCEINRQVGVLLDRQGSIALVMVGDQKSLVIPPLKRQRRGGTRLSGLRLIHTHLKSEPLSQDDLMDLALLRLDLVAALEVHSNGLPGRCDIAHLLPKSIAGQNWTFIHADHVANLEVDYIALVHSLEEELARNGSPQTQGDHRERAILIGVSTKPRYLAEDSLQELKELAQSAGLQVVDIIHQQRARIDPRFLMGKGKIAELVIHALQSGADLLVFDAELNPSQVRSITDFTELKVIDRTQLILDIFAQRARSREGQLQVEMAQLKYLLPRLAGRDDALSRLTGGIGGRGPGETKLEIDRRRVRERLHRLRQELHQIRSSRQVRRASRQRQSLPILSIIGYTNAGKSTLLNTLTHSQVQAEDRLFATLDPSSRRLRFPREREVIITDTVGFIRDLPKDLLEAFKATLEELDDADLLIHVIDLSNPRFEEQMEAVQGILQSLNLQNKPVLQVFNKIDLVPASLAALQTRVHHGVAISALDPATLGPLIQRLEEAVENLNSPAPTPAWPAASAMRMGKTHPD